MGRYLDMVKEKASEDTKEEESESPRSLVMLTSRESFHMRGDPKDLARDVDIGLGLTHRGMMGGMVPMVMIDGTLLFVNANQVVGIGPSYEVEEEE